MAKIKADVKVARKRIAVDLAKKLEINKTKADNNKLINDQQPKTEDTLGSRVSDGCKRSYEDMSNEAA